MSKRTRDGKLCGEEEEKKMSMKELMDKLDASMRDLRDIKWSLAELSRELTSDAHRSLFLKIGSCADRIIELGDALKPEMAEFAEDEAIVVSDDEEAEVDEKAVESPAESYETDTIDDPIESSPEYGPDPDWKPVVRDATGRLEDWRRPVSYLSAIVPEKDEDPVPVLDHHGKVKDTKKKGKKKIPGPEVPLPTKRPGEEFEVVDLELRKGPVPDYLVTKKAGDVSSSSDTSGADS